MCSSLVLKPWLPTSCYWMASSGLSWALAATTTHLTVQLEPNYPVMLQGHSYKVMCTAIGISSQPGFYTKWGRRGEGHWNSVANPASLLPTSA